MADLQRANLSGVNLQGAFLLEANLQGADLQRANLAGVNLQGADLSWAGLLRADLQRANLSGANLAEADLHGAVADEDTAWPEGFDPVAAGVIFD